MGENSNKIKVNIKKENYDNDEDKDILDDAVLSNYLSILFENLRENIKKVTRNSFWLMLSLVLYFLLELRVIKSVNLGFVEIMDYKILLNCIPVFFSFLYFQNSAMWNHNIKLSEQIDKRAVKLFNLGFKSNTIITLKPFSLITHFTHYHIFNKNSNKFYKNIIVIIFVLFSIFPIIFEIYTVYQIIIKSYIGLLSILSVFIIILLGVLTSVQFINAKNN